MCVSMLAYVCFYIYSVCVCGGGGHLLTVLCSVNDISIPSACPCMFVATRLPYLEHVSNRIDFTCFF